MQFVLSANDTALDKISIDPERYKDAPYLKAVQVLLTKRHHQVLKTMNTEPVCYLLLPSKMQKITS